MNYKYKDMRPNVLDDMYDRVVPDKDRDTVAKIFEAYIPYPSCKDQLHAIRWDILQSWFSQFGLYFTINSCVLNSLKSEGNRKLADAAFSGLEIPEWIDGYTLIFITQIVGITIIELNTK